MVVLASLLAFPCWAACSRLITKWDRDFNTHGDLHHNVFIDLPEKPSLRTVTESEGTYRGP